MQTCRDVGGRQQWQTQDAANNVHDIIAILVIFFDAKLVHALQHSLGVVKPATGDCDTIEYVLKSSKERLPKSAITVLRAQGQTPCRTRSCIVANITRYNAHVFRVISAYMIGNAAASQGANHGRLYYSISIIQTSMHGEHYQQLIVDARNQLECGIEVDLRELLGGVIRATVVAFRLARCIYIKFSPHS